MSLKYLIDSKYIPDDGAKEVIKNFAEKTEADIIIFPDVHMKKGALIANGMLISSKTNIYLSCLGVENCGYTFGIIRNKDNDSLVESFASFSKILRERSTLLKYTKNDILNIFDLYLADEFKKKQFLYEFLGFNSLNELINTAHVILDEHLLQVAANSLCTLGGGNHFFEVHKIVDVYEDSDLKIGDYIYMLHSDSIAVGDIIYELFSDLHEMRRTGYLKERLRVAKFQYYQKKYFKNICKLDSAIEKDLHLILNPRDNYQAIDIRTPLGKVLMLAHNLSSVFGEMNRDAIIREWSESQEIEHVKMGSHSHDNITVELHDGEIRMVHRNGVQDIGQDSICILPSAMGDYSFIMRNTFNEEAYYSTNHGTGRMQDKHIAKESYTEQQTEEELKEKRVALFRVGNGNLAEQNMKAFKEPIGIVEQMEINNLAKRVARTYPIAVIKG